MKPSKPSRGKKSCVIIPLGIFALLLVVALAIFISNQNLPQHSTTVDQLSELEKATLSEVLHLRRSLGEATWTGWSQADIPIIVYNEKYAFLVGYPDPPAGWMKIPAMEQRGGDWEQVPGDQFDGQAYYRTLITDPKKTPEAFTVLLGGRWVATLATREFGEISFYQGIRQDFPPFIANFIPVRLVWAALMGRTENYIGGIEHESFHAYQGMVAQKQLTEAESMYEVEANYPYDELEEKWYQEMDALVQASLMQTEDESINLARQFLQMRADRRQEISPAQIRLEQLREWEEGLAKFAELDITRRAGSTSGYVAVVELSQDKDFHNYQSQPIFWGEQLKEAKNRNITGDTRFYYSGNALAILLDRLSPGWKSRALPGGEFLDVLLQEAVK